LVRHTPFQVLLLLLKNKYELGRSCGTCGGEKNAFRFGGGGYYKEIDHSKDLGVNGSIVLKEILKK